MTIEEQLEVIRWALRGQSSGEIGYVGDGFLCDHQRSGLSSLLFVVVMEEVTQEKRRGLWELYVDDVVISAESEEDAMDRFRT